MNVTQYTNKHGDTFYKNDQMQMHREDGPAIEYVNGLVSYYLNGYNFKEEAYKKEMMKRRLNELI